MGDGYWKLHTLRFQKPLCCLSPQLGIVALSHTWRAHYRLTKCLEVLSSSVPVTTGHRLGSCLRGWDLASARTVAQAPSEIRAASGMNKLSVIGMCVFSYILGEGWTPVKISFLCSSQYLGSLIWRDDNLAGRRRGRAFMLVGICSHKFTGLFPS